MEVLGGSGVGIMDLNDALISNGIPPRDPVAGALWIDTSTGTSVLKVYENNKWVIQKLDVSKLDPDLATKLQGVIDTLGTIANDGILTFSDRLTLSKELAEILGTLPSKSTGNVYPSALPDYTVLDASGSGTFANMRLRAIDVGIATDTAWYKDVETTYKALNSFLSTFTPKPWDITTANKDINVVIATPDVFRQRFLDYYMAELRLATETEKQAKIKAEEYAEEIYDRATADTILTVEGNPAFTDKAHDGGSVQVDVQGKSEQRLDTNNLIYFSEPFTNGIYPAYKLRLKPNTKYTASTDAPLKGDASTKDVFFDLNETSPSSASNGIYIGSPRTITTDSTGVVNITVRKDDDASAITKLQDFKNGTRWLKVEEGTIATPFTGYSSPAPDYPIAINSLDKSFDIVSSVGKRNILPDYHFNTGAINGWTSVGYGADTVTNSVFKTVFNSTISASRIQKTFPFLKAGLYTITVNSKSTKGYMFRGFTNSTYPGVEKLVASSTNFVTESFVFNVVSDGEVIVRLYVTSPAIGDILEVDWIKLEEGSVASPSSQMPEDIAYNIASPTLYKTNILLSEPLRSVGDVKDRVFLDSLDSLWKVERNVGVKILDGTNEILKNSNVENDTNHLYYIRGGNFPNLKLNTSNVIMSHLKKSATLGELHVDDKIGFFLANGVVYFNTNISTNTRNAMNAWLASNLITVQYELNAPTIETLSAEQQTKLNNIASFKGSNYVYTTANVAPNLKATFKSSNYYRNTSVKKDLAEVSNVANSLKNFTDTAFSDGIIERAEAQAISEHLNTLKKENDDLSNQYTNIYANTLLLGTPKTNLYNSKVAYNTSYASLVASVNTAIAGNKTTTAQKADVDVKFTAYSGALKLLTQRMNEALTAISGKQATDASAVVKAELDTLSTATTALKNLTDSAFIDNVVQVAEAQAISEHLNTVKKENDDLSNQYNGIYANVLLSGAPKTNLLSAKTAYNTAYNNLIASVTSAISGNKTTVAQKADVDVKFTAYSGALKLLTQRLYESLTAISGKQATDASDAIEVGGRNVFTKNHTFTQTVANGGFYPRDIDTPNGFRVTGNSSNNGNVRLNNVITENGWWTISFDIKGSQSVAVGMTIDMCDLGATRVTTNATNTYTRVSVSVKVTNYTSAPYNFIDFGVIQWSYFWVDNIKVEKGNKATSYTEAPEDTLDDVNKKTGAPVRYIRDWINSSTANNGNHWVALQARALDGTDRARGILPTSDLALTNPTYLTNGSTATSPYVSGVTTGIQYVQVDLGKVYYDIADVRVWHYYADGRSYYNTKTEISVDGTNWEPLYDSLTQGIYPETAEGTILPTSVVDRIRIITSRVALAEQVITPEAITGTVMSQETFVEWKENVDSKANGEDVDNLMLEMGNVQDTLNGTDTTEGIITKMSTVEQKADSWSADITELKEVTGVQGTVTEQVTAYMEFKMTGLEIGKSDSDMKVNISNSQIDFMDKGVSVAYINGQKMFITQVEITESLIIGNHKIEKLDGNSDITIVSWVGQGG